MIETLKNYYYTNFEYRQLMPLRKWLILHVNKGKTNRTRVGLQDKILRKRKKYKSIVPVSYLLEAIQLQKEEEEEKKWK